jgi:RNA polymerase sigma-70 factor (ECF subfamily)
MAITTERAWDAFHSGIEQFIFKHTRDESATEDILQDVFLKMHMHITALRDEKKLQSWLYQIARHAIYDYYRDQKRLVALPDTLDLPEDPMLESEDPVLEEDVEQTLLPYLKYLVDRLPEPYREAIILTEYRGLTRRELAEYLNISISGAKSRVQRAREKLKQMLLDCCHFVLDRRGKVIEYFPRDTCCADICCCAERG